MDAHLNAAHRRAGRVRVGYEGDDVRGHRSTIVFALTRLFKRARLRSAKRMGGIDNSAVREEAPPQQGRIVQRTTIRQAELRFRRAQSKQNFIRTAGAARIRYRAA